MSTPPPYGSTPGQPQGYPGQPAPGDPQGNQTGPSQQPVYGQQAGYGQQPPYGQQPAYGQPAYAQVPGYPPTAYGAPGSGAPAPAARPGMVTAAAVLAFVWGAFAIIGGLVIVAASSIVSSAANYCNSLSDANGTAGCNTVTGYSSFFKVVTAALILVAILLIWGGVVALTGKNGQILVIGAGVYLLLDLISVIVSVSGNNFASSGLLGIVAPVLILVFMLNSASKAWFKSKGAKTF